jgi:tetratricopeptide (TPR) repeat protein
VMYRCSTTTAPAHSCRSLLTLSSTQRAAEQPLSLAVASYSSGILWLARHDLHAAVPMLERALELCDRWTLRAWFPNIATGLGEAYTRAGRVDEGRLLLEQAVEQTEALGAVTGHAYEVAMLADNVLLSGDIAAAQRLAHRALDTARTYCERGNEAVVMLVLGDIMARSESGEALACYQGAIERAAELGMRPLLARIHAALAAFHRQHGEDWKATEEAGRATELRNMLEVPRPLTAKVATSKPAPA